MPRKNTELFSRGDEGNWHNVAQLMHRMSDAGWGSRWTLYSLGYKEAADRLVESVNAGEGRQDMLVYPIVFLYRHYLELSIKELTRELWDLRGEADALVHDHQLMAMWSKLFELVDAQWPSPNALVHEPDRTAALEVIRAFTEHDRTGDAFRYPVFRDGTGTLRKVDEVNILRFQREIGRVVTVLDQIDGSVDYEKEMRALAYEALGH
jgi:hypothetical protein